MRFTFQPTLLFITKSIPNIAFMEKGLKLNRRPHSLNKMGILLKKRRN
jgi:hypothetical protein